MNARVLPIMPPNSSNKIVDFFKKQKQQQYRYNSIRRCCIYSVFDSYTYRLVNFIYSVNKSTYTEKNLTNVGN